MQSNRVQQTATLWVFPRRQMFFSSGGNIFGDTTSLSHTHTHLSMYKYKHAHTTRIHTQSQCSPDQFSSVLQLTRFHWQINGTLASETGSLQKRANSPLHIPDLPKNSSSAAATVNFTAITRSRTCMITKKYFKQAFVFFLYSFITSCNLWG